MLLGAFEGDPWFALAATTGVIFAAYYMLPMVQKVAFNALSKPANRSIPDLNGRELALLLPLVALILWLGFYPKPFLDRMAPAATAVLMASDDRSRTIEPPPTAAPELARGVTMSGAR